MSGQVMTTDPRAETQLDLFGEVEKAEQDAIDHQQALTEWQARFERADWIAPYNTQGGTPEGGRVPGWRCPDPECGEIEPSGFVLSINHGWDPDIPGREPFDGRCQKLRLLRCQARAAERRDSVLGCVHAHGDQ